MNTPTTATSHRPSFNINHNECNDHNISIRNSHDNQNTNNHCGHRNHYSHHHNDNTHCTNSHTIERPMDSEHTHILQPPAHPPPSPLPSKPFQGDYKGFGWNAQALMAASTRLQDQKGGYLTTLINSHDFGMVFETHGTPGKEHAYTVPTGCKAFWSHLSAQRAGIGVLIRNDFLSQFVTTTEESWEEIEPGRLACLHLRGPAGNLDIWAAYLTTGEGPVADYTARKHTKQLLHDNLAPCTTTLSIVTGDWNYVVHPKDRWACTSQTWTGAKDRKEAEEGDEHTFHPHNLHELYQENHTYFSTNATSRIDRVYSNHHLSEQLDHKFGCTTLTRHAGLSAHAALSYYRQRPPQRNNENTPSTLPTISNATIMHPSWPQRVAAELNSSTTTPEDLKNPIRRLLLTKKAMHTVSTNMTRDHVFVEAANNDDKLNCTLAFIRAAEDLSLTKMYRKYLEYPYIGTVVDPNDPNTCNTKGLQQLRNHAVSLAKQHLTDELQEAAHQSKEQPQDYRVTVRKNNILTHLKKLTPGNAASIGAVDMGEDGFATDPKQISELLATHWAKTFAHKPINKHLLRDWLAALPDLTPHQQSCNPPPPPQTESSSRSHPVGHRDAPLHMQSNVHPGAACARHNTVSTPPGRNHSGVTHSETHNDLVARAMHAGIDLRGHINAVNSSPQDIHSTSNNTHSTDSSYTHSERNNGRTTMNDHVHHSNIPTSCDEHHATQSTSNHANNNSTRQQNHNHASTQQSQPQPQSQTPLGPLGRPSKLRKPLPTGEVAWRVRRKDIEQAIRHSGNSAPGPDGIPFKAWRALGPLGVSILHDVAAGLETDAASQHLNSAYHEFDPRLGHHYNHSILVCLPKKSTTTTEDGTKAYTLNNTRPLSIVNCDNRIVASAARNRWEGHLADWILPRQQGFLRGRSILANLLQVDTAAMITSLTQPGGACILLDFASAFPSISQEFLFTTLQHIGLPKNALNLLSSLYSNSFCDVKHGSTSTPGFLLETGVRQGCPLSPLLYATVAEILMDTVEHRCNGTLTRCYADDTALVINNFWDNAPKLQELFQEFAEVSGLHLNLKKCVILPLDEGSLDTFRQRLDATIPLWKNMQVVRHGTYLGFTIGPEKGDMSWHDPTQKFLQRCQLWEAQGAGMHYHITAYNTFALSTLSYIAQMEKPPPETLSAEKEGLKKVIKGPHIWIEPGDLWRLKEHYGQSSSCKSLHHMALAAQLRVRRCDPSCRHPHHQLNVEDLHKALHGSKNDINRLRWASWYQRSFALTLESTTQHYTKHIGPIDDLISSQNPSNNDALGAPGNNTKQHFQRNAYNKLLQAERYNPTTKNRRKFMRWELHDAGKHPIPPNTTCRQNTPAWRARRALANLQLLRQLTPPRVCAAALSTLWNRWCTHRRYQKRHCQSNVCLLGCGGTAEDSIEHYFSCTVTKDTLLRQLNLPPHLFANLHSGLLCNANIQTTDQLTAIALLIYGLYNTTNHLRHNPGTPATQITDMLAQHIREGAKHHPQATGVLDSRWNRDRQSRPLPPIPYTI